MIEKMWEILTTLTEESQQAALSKCKELSLDPNRGVVSLDESFINLNSARSILMDAIEKKKLIQLPITVQKTLTTHLEAISKYQAGLTAGTDEVVNLTSAIEQLNMAIWQYGLHNLSEEVLGYQFKLNQLKVLEVEAKKLRRDLDAGIKLKDSLDKLLIDAGKHSETLPKFVTTANEVTSKVNEELTKTTEASQKAAALLAVIQQNETTSTQQLATTKTSNAAISALEKKIKEFYEQVDVYRDKISKAADNASSAIQNNNTETEKLTTRLKELEDQIKTQIQKATGYSLFHSFQTRKDALVWSKRLWGLGLTLLVILAIGLPWFVIKTTTNIDVAFFLKLSMSFPIIYAIVFCAIQYSRERKLEEEYAFKSNISISLVPYQELVDKLVAKDHPAEREKYAAFIMDSISKVFSSPTDKVFDSGEKRNFLSKKTLKQLSSIIEGLKGLKP